MKDSRINIRIPHAEKEAWESIADTYGMTLTEFVTRSVRRQVLDLETQQTNTSGNSANVASFYSWRSGG